MSVFTKLQECRVKLQEMNLKKSGENKFAKFKYYELADFLPSINKLFLEYKLCSNFSINSYYAKLTIYDAEDTNSNLEFTSTLAPAELRGATPIQSLGAEHTYLKRYLYLNALEIVEGDALDASLGSDKVKKTYEKKVNEKPQEVKKEEDLEIPKEDLDFHKGLDEITDVETLQEYYKSLSEHVLNKRAFNVAVSKKKKELGG